MEYGIGIDLGGTEIKAAAFGLPTGDVLSKTSAPTCDGDESDGEPAFVAAARDLVVHLESALGGEAAQLGVSAPGLADRAGICIRCMPDRLAGIEGLDWSKVFARSRVPVLNDAHAALLGERWQGAARGMDDVIMLTLGTGVGGAAVSGGRLLRGFRGRAGHLGHSTIDFEGLPDICNTPGSLEAAIGNETLPERAAGRFGSTHELVAAYAEGDPDASTIWNRSLRALAASIVSFINVLDPRAVIIGGGIGAAGAHLFDPLEKLVREREWQPAGARVELLPAELGQWAGTYGALRNALEESQ